MPEYLEYSDKYTDDTYEYRHVFLTQEVFNRLPKGKLLAEEEWRRLGI
jgi:cyclin-dependent kinase regulatory subunit CKS1